MDKQTLVNWIREQLYVGKTLGAREEQEIALLSGTLERFCAYLSETHGIARFEDATLEALQHFPFDLPANDDQHLRAVFSHLGRRDLVEHLGAVSADKYFRNKKLPAILKAMDDLKGYAKDLRKAGVRMASELLERGATPEGRARLVEITGIPAGDVLKLVQCCDLCRMTGMNGKTLMRAMALGYDTLAKFRTASLEQIEAELAAYLSAREERTNRMVPFSSFVHKARKLEDVIVY